MPTYIFRRFHVINGKRKAKVGESSENPNITSCWCWKDSETLCGLDYDLHTSVSYLLCISPIFSTGCWLGISNLCLKWKSWSFLPCIQLFTSWYTVPAFFKLLMPQIRRYPFYFLSPHPPPRVSITYPIPEFL